MATRDTKDPRSQLHIRLPDDVIALLDEQAEKMTEEMRKVSPTIKFSRADVAYKLILDGLTCRRMKRAPYAKEAAPCGLLVGHKGECIPGKA